MKIPVYKIEGIIIRKFNSNEFDKLLVVYTKEFGKILVKAKSLRKKEAKMKSQLELFNQVHLMLAKGRNIDTISGVALIDGLYNIKRNLESLLAAFYVSELLDKLIVGSERDERIWQLVLKFFNFLEEKQRNKATIEKLLDKFECNLLSYLGHGAEKERESYLDKIQHIIGGRIESKNFLTQILAWG